MTFIKYQGSFHLRPMDGLTLREENHEEDFNFQSNLFYHKWIRRKIYQTSIGYALGQSVSCTWGTKNLSGSNDLYNLGVTRVYNTEVPLLVFAS
jgi:hypothetical protein